MRVLLWSWLICSCVLSATIETSSFPNSGTQKTLLHVDVLGRYRISAESVTGSSIELVDRLSGPVLKRGEAGRENGYLDLFLEVGTYQLICENTESGPGTVELKVLPFAHQPMPTPDYLEVVEADLGDMEERSFWVQHDGKSEFRFEAMGRCLKEVRVWYPGDWVDHHQPHIEVRDVRSGQPMTHIEVFANLSPGLYRVSMIGGEPLAWAQESNQHPLLVRIGVPKFDRNARMSFKLSPFGRDVFLAKSSADFLQIRTKEQVNCRLEQAPYHQDRSRFQNATRSRTMTNKSRTSLLTLSGRVPTDLQWVRIQGEPGLETELLFFEANTSEIPRDRQNYLVSSMSSFEADNAVDMSAVGIPISQESTAWEVFVPRLDPETGFTRRLNLLGTSELTLFVEKEGLYVVHEKGDAAGCEYQWTHLSRLNQFRQDDPVPFELADKPVPLSRGYYQLSIRPKQKGILQFSIVPESSQPVNEATAARTDFLRLSWKAPGKKPYYTLKLADRFGVSTGLFFQKLPVDLNQSISLPILPGEFLSFAVRVEPGHLLKVLGLNPNSGLEVYLQSSINGRVEKMKPDVKGIIKPLGSTMFYTAHVQNKASEIQWMTMYQVVAQEAEIDPAGLVDSVSGLPVLEDGQERFQDFTKRQRHAFLLEVTDPGLYTLATSGRLAMGIHVRTRLNTGLYSGSKNGTGRNALVNGYFDRGTYLVLVDALGNSVGRAGLKLVRQEQFDGGAMTPGSIEKEDLPAGTGLVHHVEIPTKGTFEIETLGLGKEFFVRLEDAQGWPVFKPGKMIRRQLELTAGAYAYRILPEAVASRMTSSIKELKEEKPLSGKGPHQLPWNREIAMTWKDGAPDRFQLDAPAEMKAYLKLSEGMFGELIAADGSTTAIQGGSRMEVVLERGGYLLHLKRSIQDDFFPYTLRLDTDQLAPGIEQVRSHFPVDLPMVIGTDELVDLSSFGSVDVSAVLIDEQGSILARLDDSADWNIEYSAQLKAGTYTLRAMNHGTNQGPVRFALQSRKPIELSSQPFPFQWSGDLRGAVLHLPFEMKRDGVISVVNSDPNIQLSVQKGDSVIAEGRGELWIPLKGDERYMLKAWVTGGQKGQASLSSSFLDVKRESLSRKLKLKPGQLYQVALEEPVSLDINPVDVQVEASGNWEEGSAKLDRMVHPQASTVWLRSKRAVTLQAAQLKPGERLSVPLNQGRAHLSAKSNEFKVLRILSPGLELLGSVGDPGSTTYWNRMWLQPGQTWLVGGSDESEMVLWNGNLEEGSHLVEVELLDINEGNMTLDGERGLPTQTIQPRQMVRIKTSGLTGMLRCRTEAGVMVVWGNEQGPLQLEMQRDSNLQSVVELGSGVEWIRIYNSRGSSAKFDLQLDPVTSIGSGHLLGSSRVTLQDQPIDLNMLDGQVKWLDVKSAHSIWAQHSAGESVHVRFFGAKGSYQKSWPLVPDVDGVVGAIRIEAPPGRVRVWSAPSAKKKWASLGEPMVVHESQAFGKAMQLSLSDQVESWPLSVETAIWAQLNLSDQADVVLLGAEGNDCTLHSGSAQASNVVFLSPGTHTIKGRARSGSIVRVSIHAIEMQTLTEEEPERFIGPGQWHAYQFDLAFDTTVGLGLQGADLVGLLFSSTGQLIDRSAFLVQSLPQGSYVYLVTTESEAQLYRPRVIGLTPNQEIPEDVIKTFMEGR